MRRTELLTRLCALLLASVCSALADEPSERAPTLEKLRRHDGGRLAYYHWPADGPSLLLIPGSWSEYRQFDAIRRGLDSQINLVIVELPGHGRSQPPMLHGSIESFAKEVLLVTDALGWAAWYAGGHSIGGMLAIELAAQRPKQVIGAISLEGWTHHLVLKEAFAGQVYGTLTKAQEKIRLRGRRLTLNRLKQDQIDAFRSIWTRWDGQPILETTCAKILEVWGDRDRPRPSLDAMRIPRRDNIRVHWVYGASHSLPIERPTEVAAAINRFVVGESSH